MLKDVEIPSELIKVIELVPGPYSKVGADSGNSPQFFITIGSLESIKNGTVVRGIVNFQRIPNYQIFCTYLPTTCILIMAVLTMFIDESHFEATIMVALTAMLVLYTLFQSISEVMPTTSYLKLIGKSNI